MDWPGERMMWMRTRRGLTATLVAMATIAASWVVDVHPAPAQPLVDAPNIILVVTDDMRWDSLDSMPWLERRARTDGAWFAQAYAALPQCCPSRASILTGRYVHNHEVWKSAASEKEGVLGGHAGLRSVEDHTIATWLDDAGYTTALVGKYANGFPAYPEDEGGLWTIPPGWDEWTSVYQPAPIEPVDIPTPAQQDPTSRGYGSFTVARGGDGTIDRLDAYRNQQSAIFRVRSWPEEPTVLPRAQELHSTKTYGHITRQTVNTHAADSFFLWLNFTAPHLVPEPTAPNADASVDLIDRTTNGYTENAATNEELVTAGKPLWVRELPSMASYTCNGVYSAQNKCADAATSLEMEADQRRTLLDVDREMRRLFETLETTLDENGVPLIETTYVIFTSDHGFMWGEHRIPHNKGVPYEESIAVPFVVFGPDIDPGKKSAVVSLIDIAPTILDWAGIDREAVEQTAGLPLDGESLAAMLDGTIEPGDFTVNVRGGVLAESKQRLSAYDPAEIRMPGWEAYTTTRWKVIRYDASHVTVSTDPEGISIEGYDLRNDPFELQSLYVGAPPGAIIKTEAVMDQMATCSGTAGPESCSIPAAVRWGS